MSDNVFQSKNEYLKQRLQSFSREPLLYQYGKVCSVGDGVVRVSGLPGRSYGELLEFDGGIFGMALDLEEDGVGAVLFDSADSVSVGHELGSFTGILFIQKE